jgi:hypothetical protein
MAVSSDRPQIRSAVVGGVEELVELHEGGGVGQALEAAVVQGAGGS